MEEGDWHMIELFDHLLNSGFEVYFIGQKWGMCEKPYIVIRDAGTIPIYSNKAGTQIIDIIGYVPESRYTQIIEMKKNIKEAMKDFPARITGEESPVIPDNSNKSYSFIITYQIQKLIQ